MTIGAVGKIEVEKAREAARKIIAGTELGQDHAAERARSRAELTVTELCALYLAEGCETKKASTLATDRGRLNGTFSGLANCHVSACATSPTRLPT